MKDSPTRLEQLGNLLTAMIAVIISGQTDLLFDGSKDQPSRIEELASGYLDIPDEIRIKFHAGGPYFGALREIASRLDVAATVVSNVFRGRAQSKRIALALLQYLVDREGEQAITAVQRKGSPYVSVFTPEERKEFLSKGRYFGALSAVARKLSLPRNTIYMVVHGMGSSSRIVGALRGEMSRMDLTPKRKKPASISFLKEERASFQKGGQHYGIFLSVAANLGIKPSSVAAVVAGRWSSPRIADAVRHEMTRIDAEIASQDAAVLSKEEASLFSFRGKYCGIYSAVGHSLGVGADSIRRQALGLVFGRNSIRIRRAVRLEMARFDQERGKPVATLSDVERAQFSRGRRYFGLYTIVAKKFGMSHTRVIEAALRENASLDLRRALRIEMARIDAEIAAKGGQ